MFLSAILHVFCLPDGLADCRRRSICTKEGILHVCLAKRAPETFKLSDDADLNDAAQFSTDPTFRLIGSPTRWDRSAALTSTLHLFETELLSHWMSYIVTVQPGRIHHTLLHGRARPHTGR